jgi:uncharacterized metal-binding protein YceD (DUF177 family)
MTLETTMNNAVEFSRPQATDKIGGEAIDVSIEADEAERAALGRRFDLCSFDHFAAFLTLCRSEKTGWLEVKGRFQASLSQQCVVSLEPVKVELDVSVMAMFSDKSADVSAVDIDVDMEDPPEPIKNNSIDVGELIAQQLAVSLDPYPRALGTKVPAEGLSFGAKIEEFREDNPFAVLRELK